MDSDFFFGAWLKQQRRALDCSREQLAGQIGCSISLLEKIETGERRPSRQIATRIALCLAIPPEQRDAFLVAARAGRAPHDVGQIPTPTAPSAAVPPHTNRLPSPITSFIGREWEIDQGAETAQLLQRGLGARLAQAVADPGGQQLGRIDMHIIGRLQCLPTLYHSAFDQA